MARKKPPIPGALLVPPERPHYFAGRLLTAEDFGREQEYHTKARRRLALLVLGPGVVSGLEVMEHADGGLRVAPGVAIDRLGREIIVPAETPVECSSPMRRRGQYVCLAYAEERIDPVPVLGAENAAEHGAMRETFRVWTSDEAPVSDSADGAIVLARVSAGRVPRKKKGRA